MSPALLPTVSVCIPAYNEERNIGPLLAHLREVRLTSGTLHEVLVDISGSTDRTREIVHAQAAGWPLVRAVDAGERDGLLCALDRLIQRASGDIVVRIDADVRLEPPCLDLLVEALRDPQLGIVSPRIVPGPSRSAFVDVASRAEWAVHDFVSRSAPKTTVVQAFRRVPIALPSDAGLEDAGLQQQVEAAGLRAGYVPQATVSILPPSTVRGMLVQRIRTIQHIRDHMRRGYARPATATFAIVWRSLWRAIRLKQTSVGAVALFGLIEAAARTSAGASRMFATSPLFGWEPVEGTKDFGWAVGPNMRSGIADAPTRPPS